MTGLMICGRCVAVNKESWESDCGVSVILVWQVVHGCCGEESEWWHGLLGLGGVVACVE